MLFRKAETCEAEAIRVLYQAVIGTPFCTWDESYPGETEIAGDLSADTLYVLEEDHQVIGAISIVSENELDHFSCWSVKENAREFARVVIKPDQQHKGLSVCLVEGVIRKLQKQGFAAIHIAVAKENIPALSTGSSCNAHFSCACCSIHLLNCRWCPSSGASWCLR